MLDLLQPGCNGVLVDYKSVLRKRIKEAYTYMLDLLSQGVDIQLPEGDEPDDPQEDELYDPQEDELYDPQEEFGGQEVDYDDYDHVTEGGGDFEDQRHRDEL